MASKKLEYGSEERKDVEVGDVSSIAVDKAAERSYVRKMDLYLLPFMSIMYFFNSIDRSNIGNAKTDKFDVDMHFTGNQYSLLLLLFYIPNALFDLPLNLLTKRFSGRLVLSTLCVAWGGMSILQIACKNFGGMLVVRLILGAFEAGFFAGAVFYLSLFYNRGELGFRIALFFGSAVLAAAFSGLLAYGVFQIQHTVLKGWQYLFLIEGTATVLIGITGYWWLPESASQCRWLTPEEKGAAIARSLRDSSQEVASKFSLKEAFKPWKDWKMGFFTIISFTYPVCWVTTSTFLPQIVQRLGYSTVKTNLWTVAPNAVGFVVFLSVAWSSDHFRERTYHIIFALSVGLVGVIILATLDVDAHKGVAYFACFLLTSGAYIPSCLVHTWHNNNNLNENARAANTGIFVGLGNLSGILSTATFRTEYAPRYAPTLIATACCSGTCIVFTAALGTWMKRENARRNREQGVLLKAGDVDTDMLQDGERSPQWRYFT